MKKTLKVAIVHEMFVKMGGAERVIQSLLTLFPNADIFTLLQEEEVLEENFPGKEVKVSRLQKFTDFYIPRQLLVTKMPRAIEDFDFTEYDLVISSSSAFAHGVIVPSNVAHVSYVHAPMRYAWDYTHTYIEEKSAGFFGWGKKFLLRHILYFLRIWDFTAASRPDILIANSQTTARRIQKFWRRESEIVFPPVDIERFELNEVHENFFLIVSALEPFKSIDIAVDAFLQMPEKKLIIIGDGSMRQELEKKCENASNIEILGRKSDDAVKEYMEKCTALIFPGLEDFGITPVEAMACGKPVIAHGKGGVAESVVDGKTGVFFPELSTSSFLAAMKKFEEKQSYFQRYRKQIRKRAEEFSEEKFLEKFLKIVEKITTQ